MNASEGGGADLLAPLREMDYENSPPPGYDVARAMRRAGTIRRRRVRAGVFAAAVAVAVAVPVMLYGQGGGHSVTTAGGLSVAACTGRAIAAPVEAGAYTTVVGAAIDPSGRYLALTVARPDVPDRKATHAILVDRRTDTTTVLPLDHASAVAVNSNGVVTGWNGKDQTSPFVYDGHNVVNLPSFGGEAATPTAIGANGDVVGYSTNHDG